MQLTKPHTTQEITDFIFARDAQERAGAGGIDAVEEVELVAVPTGKTWQHNQIPGPLDGQPENKWQVKITYQNGKQRIFTGDERSIRNSKKES